LGTQNEDKENTLCVGHHHTQDTRRRQIKQKPQHNFVEHHYKLIIKRK